MLFNISSALASDLRILKRILKETIKGIGRTGLVNIVIIATMASILSIFGCLFRISLEIYSFVDNLGSNMEISVYLQDKASSTRVAKEIKTLDNVKSISIIKKEKAWQDMKKHMQLPDVSNPLPDKIRVKLKDNDSSKIDKLIKKVKKIRGVEATQYAKEILDKVKKIGEVANAATMVVFIVLGGLTLSIINNTIHLVIQSRKQEIEIMRMMGVSNWYIRSPYILQGAFYGFSGGLISIFALGWMEKYLSNIFKIFQVSGTYIDSTGIALVILSMGTAVGSLGSIISVRKYLKI